MAEKEQDTYLNRVYMQFSERRAGASEATELADLQHLMYGSRKRTADPKMPGARRFTAALRKVVAERFVQARALNELSQTDAAIRMGYKKSTQLSLWEKGHRLPPIDRMIIVALVYGVSLDYLYGLSDDAERDQQFAARETMTRLMQDQLRGHAERIAESLVAFSKTGGINILTIKALVARASEAATSMRRFASLNAKKFDNMAGSATVMHACVSLEALVREASSMVSRAEGMAEQAIVTAERRAGKFHPLFETPEYRQRELGGLDG